MRTYSRRNSQPVRRSDASDIAGNSTPSTPSDQFISDGDHTRSHSSSGSKSAAVPTPTEPTTNRQASIEQPAPTPPRPSPGAAAVSIERKRRRLALTAVPICPLSSTPAPSPSASIGAFGVERRSGSSGGKSGGGRTGEGGGRSFGSGRSDSNSLFGVRTLWCAGDPLSAGRKRRRPGVVKSAPAIPSTGRQQQQQQQQQRQEEERGSSLKKRPGGKGGETGRRVSPESGKKEQMFLDFGQKSLGQRILCPQCDMLYVCGSADDEAQHASICAKAARGLHFAGWKQERVKEWFPDDGGRVVEIREGDHATHLAKLGEVERLMDVDMGFAPGAREEKISPLSSSSTGGRNGGGDGVWGGGRGSVAAKGGGEEGLRFGSATKKRAAVTAFLYVRGKRVLGCVVAERIESARRAVLVAEAVASAPGEGKKTAARPQTPSRKSLKAASMPNVSGVGLASAALCDSPPRPGGVEFLALAVETDRDAERCGAGKATAAAAVEPAAKGSGADTHRQQEGDYGVPAAFATLNGQSVSHQSGEHHARGTTLDDDDDADGASATTATAPVVAGPSTSTTSSAGPPLSPSRVVNEAPPLPQVRGAHHGKGTNAHLLGSAADGVQAPPRSVSGVRIAGSSTTGVGPAAVTKKMRAGGVGGVGGVDGGGGSIVGASATSSSSSAKALSKLEPSSRGRPRQRRPSKKLGGNAKSGATPSLERFWLPQRSQQPSGASIAAAVGAREAESLVDGKIVGKVGEGKSGEGMVSDAPTEIGQGQRSGGAADEPRHDSDDLQGLRAWTAGKVASAAAPPAVPAAAAAGAGARIESPCHTEGSVGGAGSSQEEVAISSASQQRCGGESRGQNRGRSDPTSSPRREETGGEGGKGLRNNRADASPVVSEVDARAPTAAVRAAAGTKTARLRASPWSFVPAVTPAAAAAAATPKGASTTLASPSADRSAALPLAATGGTAAPSPAPKETASLVHGGDDSGEASGNGPETGLKNLSETRGPSGFGAHDVVGEKGRIFCSEKSEVHAQEGGCSTPRSTCGGGDGGTERKGVTAAGAVGSSRRGSEIFGDGVGGGDGGDGDVGGGIDGVRDTGGVGGVGGVYDRDGSDGGVCDRGVSGVDVTGAGTGGRASGAGASRHLAVPDNSARAAEKRNDQSSRPLPSERDGNQKQAQHQQRPWSPVWSMDSASLAGSEEVPSPGEKKEVEEEPSTPLPTTVLTCEDKDSPAVVGILQVWVHEQSRRQGVATRLVDTVRKKMVYGLPLRREQVAFSQPTREGQAFAIRYTGGEGKLLVY